MSKASFVMSIVAVSISAVTLALVTVSILFKKVSYFESE